MPGKKGRSAREVTKAELARALAPKHFDAPFTSFEKKQSSWDKGEVDLRGGLEKNLVFACLVPFNSKVLGGFAGRTVQTPLGQKTISSVVKKRVLFADGSVGEMGGVKKNSKAGSRALFVQAPDHLKPEVGFAHAGFLPVHSSPSELLQKIVDLNFGGKLVCKKIISADAKASLAGARVTRVKFTDNSFGHAFELPDGRFTLFARPPKAK